MLLLPSEMQKAGDATAHSSMKEYIGESVLALEERWERDNMIVIFWAVFNLDPTL